MRRIGLFTHRIYSQEDYDAFVIKECTIVLPESCRTEREIQEIVGSPRYKCGNCYGCPNAKEALEREAKKEKAV